MVVVDIILAILLLIAIWHGWKKGIVYQIISLIAVFIGIYIAKNFWHFLFHILQSKFHWNESILKYVSMILTAILIILGVIIVGKLLSKLIEVTIFGVVDKILGALLSLVEGVVIISFLIYSINFLFPKNDVLKPRNIEKSFVLPYIEPIAGKIIHLFDTKAIEDEKEKNDDDKNILVIWIK